MGKGVDSTMLALTPYYDIMSTEMTLRELPGYAIGGLSGGEEKDKFWRIVKICTELLPEDKPRYCMGVG